MPRKRKHPSRAEQLAGAEEKRELIAPLIVDGLTDPEIAAELGLPVRTVKYHVGRLCELHEVARKRELIPILRELG